MFFSEIFSETSEFWIIKVVSYKIVNPDSVEVNNHWAKSNSEKKGTLGRAVAGSCQFAVTILMYEELKLLGKYFGYDYDDQDSQNFKKVVDCKKCNYYDKTHLVKNPLPG